MRTPQEVELVRHLAGQGMSQRAIARHLGCCPRTVHRYLAMAHWQPYGHPHRERQLDGCLEWLKERFAQHHGNAEVLRQELLRQKGIHVSQRTVERAVEPWRAEWRAARLATVRFETPPGKQLQADFGQCVVAIGGEATRLHLCVLTLGYSRRMVIRAFRTERQANWLLAMEEAFRHWGGVPNEVLVDNARALVLRHDPASGELVFHPRFAAFARHWGFTPKACQPYRPRTKGKDERGVRYVKGSGLAGHDFPNWGAMEAHLEWWNREVADVRIHRTTGEQPLARFQREEVSALMPLKNRPSYLAEQEFSRVVANDCCVQVEGNWYSVPNALVRQRVSVLLRNQRVLIRYRGHEVARHQRQPTNHRHRQVISGHWAGLLPQRALEQAMGVDTPEHVGGVTTTNRAVRSSALARPLAEYAALIEEMTA